MSDWAVRIYAGACPYAQGILTSCFHVLLLCVFLSSQECCFRCPSCVVVLFFCFTPLFSPHSHFYPRPCSSTYPWARLATHRHWGPLCVYTVLSWPTMAALTPHVCHRQRNWAVSIGSHMQQDIDISKAPPHLGAPVALFEHHSRLKTTIQNIGNVSCECSNACFPLRWAPFVQNHAHVHNCCCCSSKKIL